VVDRVAIVTGAAGGIGRAVVAELASQGVHVVAVDTADVDEPQFDPKLRTLVADVRDPEAMREAVELARREFGSLDVAVAAAAVMAGGRPLWETTDAEWDALFGAGVRGVAYLAKAAIPAMLQRPEPRSGRFVALASAAAHQGMWHLAGYNAAKHAVVGLIRGLAHDLRGTGITASAVSPGSTRTPMLDATASLYGLDDIETFAQYQLTGRLLEPDEVAAAVTWLCSPEASAINGTVVHADAGFTA
jgi:SDR family mycofactocin-dependent oxidoreductase